MKKFSIKSIFIKKWNSNCSSKTKIEQKENLIRKDFINNMINKKCLRNRTYIY